MGADFKWSIVLYVPGQSVSAEELCVKIERLLELLADLTERFEVLVVGTGEAEVHEERVRELSTVYPQVRWVGGSVRAGSWSWLGEALEQARGELLVLLDGAAPIRYRALEEVVLGEDRRGGYRSAEAGWTCAETGAPLEPVWRGGSWAVLLRRKHLRLDRRPRLLRRHMLASLAATRLASTPMPAGSGQ